MIFILHFEVIDPLSYIFVDLKIDQVALKNVLGVMEPLAVGHQGKFLSFSILHFDLLEILKMTLSSSVIAFSVSLFVSIFIEEVLWINWKFYSLFLQYFLRDMQGYFNLRPIFLNTFKRLCATSLSRRAFWESQATICISLRNGFITDASHGGRKITLYYLLEATGNHSSFAFIAGSLKIAASISCSTFGFDIFCWKILDAFILKLMNLAVYYWTWSSCCYYLHVLNLYDLKAVSLTTENIIICSIS